MSDSVQRSVLPIPPKRAHRSDDVRREGRRGLPADHAPAAARRCSERAGRAARRRAGSARRARSAGRAGRRRPTGWPRQRAALQPVPHHRPVLPTRAALLGGRNHHTVGMGGITEIATSAPGIQLDAPRRLRAAGRDAAAQRLQHRPVRQVSRGPGLGDEPGGPVRPVAHRLAASSTSTASSPGRPTSSIPVLYEGTTPIDPPRTPEEGYHLTEDIADQADRLGAPAEVAEPGRAVLHVLRARSDARATPRPGELGRPVRRTVRRRAGTPCASARSPGRRSSALIPPDAELTARPDEIPAWDDMPAELRPVLARQMEIYAAFLEHTDHHVGRVIDALDEIGALENTLVYYIIGDNGASAEGTVNGTFNELLSLNGAADLETTASLVDRLADFGTPAALQPLRRGLGARHVHALPVDQAGRLALGRDPQRHRRPLAGRLRGEGRGPHAVLPRHRRRADGAGGRGAPRADVRQRHPAAPVRGHEHGLHVR